MLSRPTFASLTVALAAMAGGAPSHAQSTDELLRSCQFAKAGTLIGERASARRPGARDPDRATLCLTYFEGIADGLGVAQSLLIGRSVDGVCVPPGIIAPRLAATFVTWAEGNPQLVVMPRDQAVLSAMLRAFPCR